MPAGGRVPTMVESNKLVMRRYFEEGLNRGDMAVVREIFATDYVHHDPANLDPIGGTADVERHITTLRAAFPDINFSVEGENAEGDDVVVRWSANLTHLGDFFGLPATHRKAHITGVNWWRMQDGKAVEGWVSRDDLGLMRQLGVIPGGEDNSSEAPPTPEAGNLGTNAGEAVR